MHWDARLYIAQDIDGCLAVNPSRVTKSESGHRVDMHDASAMSRVCRRDVCSAHADGAGPRQAMGVQCACTHPQLTALQVPTARAASGAIHKV